VIGFSGKLPLAKASAKFRGEKGPVGVSKTISGGPPGRSNATAIHANGTAHGNAAAPTANIAISRKSAFMIGTAFERTRNNSNASASSVATLITVLTSRRRRL